MLLIFFLVLGFELCNSIKVNEGIIGKIKKKGGNAVAKGTKETGDAAWKAVKEPVMDEIKMAKEYVKKATQKLYKYLKKDSWTNKKLFCIWTLSLIPKDGAKGEKYKGLREFFNDNVNKDNKELGGIIKDLILAIIKAIFIILVMIPLLTIAIGFSIGPIMSFFVSIFMSFISFITSPFST